MKKRILVPTDFTKVGDTALNHALIVGKALEAEVHCLHVIANKRDISIAKLKLETLQSRME
jgi:nucleotide-binding universal stress UspA family protein